MLFKTSKGRLATIDTLSDKNEDTIETVSESVGYTEKIYNNIKWLEKQKRIQLIKTERQRERKKKIIPRTVGCR